MTSLHVILDEVGEPSRTSIGRYGEELARALIETAPDGIDVEGFTAGAKAAQRDRIARRLPGIADLRLARIPARELREAWLHTVTTMPMPGLVHATSLLAPMRSDGKADGDQWVVTVHGTSALSDRSTRKTRWFERALRRAHRLADAIVVPSHAVATRLQELHDFGDRLRVIGAGVATGLRLPVDVDDRAERLGLPDTFVLAMTTPSNRAAASAIIDVVASSAMPDVPVVLVGPVGWGDLTIAELAVAAGLPASRILMLGDLDDADLAVVYDRAEAMLLTDTHDGFGLPLLEAFSFGTPVVHLAQPTLAEIAGDASVAVPMVGDGTQAERLAHAVATLLGDPAASSKLALLGEDRVRAFSWTGAAAQVWQLHADL